MKSVCFEKFFEVTSVTFLSLHNLEEAMQLRRLIKSVNESLGPYLFGKFEYILEFLGPQS